MSNFDAIWDDFAGDILMEEFGDRGIYHPYGVGDDVALTCQAAEEHIVQRQRGDRTILLRELEVTVSTDPTSQWGGVSTVDRRSEFSVNSVRYAIAGSRGAAGSFAVLVLQRPELGGMFPSDDRGRGG